MTLGRNVISRSVRASLVALALPGCTGIPEGVEPVSGFKLQQYLGTWYEIARLDHGFEEGLSRVTATYRARDDGGIEVINRGYLDAEDEWQEATGKGYFQESSDVGLFKVSFFGPFYSSYVIFELDDAYQHAFVTGNTQDYLWLLARTPQISPQLREDFLRSAKTLGYHTQDLIWVQHQPLEK